MKKEIVFSFFMVIFIIILILPFASKWPDGLEKVAEDKGFIEKGEGASILPALIPDYLFPGIKNEKIATLVAGASGVLIIFLLFYGLFRQKR